MILIQLEELVFKPIINSLCLFISFGAFAATYEALTVPEVIRVTSSEPRKQVWQGLTQREKNLATHLLAAASAGKIILLNQNHRNGLLIKNVLEASLNQQNISTTKAALGDSLTEYLNYAIKFEDQVGPYASANRKYVLRKTTPDQVRAIFARHAPQADAVAVEDSVKL